jgi:serine/threonine-protein kinase
VALSSGAAHDYDPGGDGTESHDQRANAIDGNPTTVWDTEQYEGGFAGSHKAGVGIYLDTESRVAARQMDVVAATPDFQAAVYASDTVPNRIDQWRKVSGTTTVKRVQKIPLDTAGQRFRYYLLWISELPDGGQVAIKELSLKK